MPDPARIVTYLDAASKACVIEAMKQRDGFISPHPPAMKEACRILSRPFGGQLFRELGAEIFEITDLGREVGKLLGKD